MTSDFNKILQILMLSPEATAIYDSEDLHIAFANQSMLRLWDRSEKIIGSNFGDTFPEFIRQGFVEILQNVWKTGITYHATDTPAEILVNGRKPTICYFDFEYKALLDGEGKTYAILHTATEVSERMASQRAIREKEGIEKSLNEELKTSNKELKASLEEIEALNKQMTQTITELQTAYEDIRKAHDHILATEETARLLLNQAPVAVGVIDAEHYLLDAANGLLLTLWNINNSHIGQPLASVLDIADAKILSDIINTVKMTGKSIKENEMKILTERYRKMDTRYYNFVYQPIKNSQSKVVRVMIVANEVTEQYRAKATLQHALEQARLAKLAANLGMFDLDVKRNKLIWDDRCKEIFGISSQKEVSYIDDFLGRLHPEDKDHVVTAIQHALQGADTGQVDIVYRAVQTNKVTWVHARGKVHFDYDGTPARLIGTVIDVTDSVLAKQELEDRELRLNLALDSAEIGTWDLNIHDNMILWDKRAKELFGIKEDHTQPIPYDQVLSYIYHEDRPAVQDAVAIALDSASGGHYHIQYRANYVGEKDLRWIDTKGRAYFDAAGRPTRFSGTMIDVTETVTSRNRIQAFNRLIARKEKKQRLIVDAGKIGTFTFDKALRSVVINDHVRQMFGFDRHVDVSPETLFSSQIALSGQQRVTTLLDIIEQHQRFDELFEIDNQKTGEHMWLRIVGNNVIDQEENTYIAYGVFINMTAQKMEEQRKLDFLSIVSHELRSPLTALSGYLQILQLKTRNLESDLFCSLLENANRQASRMKSLIEGLLDTTRIADGKLTLRKAKFDLAELMATIEQTLLETTSSHQFLFETFTDLPIDADKDKVEQVIINLINNAVKYSPKDSSIKVHTNRQEEQVLVRVTDSGPGIAQDDQTKIFDRFYRVQNEHSEIVSGFGIGLYISKEIVHLHGGKMGLDSALGKGTTFWFSIPCFVETT